MYELYNEQFKQEFLSSIKSEASRTKSISVLRTAAKQENQLQKDLVYFDESELKNLFIGSKWVKSKTVEDYASIIRQYMMWYLRFKAKPNEIDLESSIERITPVSISADSVYETEWFRNPTEFSKFIYKIYNDPNIINVNRYDTILVISILLYFGIKLDDAKNIEKKWVSDKKNEIQIPESESVYINVDYLMDIIRQYRDSGSYKSNNPYGTFERYYPDTSLLIRVASKTGLVKSNTIKKQLIDISKTLSELGYEKKIVFKNIYKSGLYYRALCYEQQHGTFTPRDTICAKLLEYKPASETNENVILQQLKLKYKDYSKWKKYCVNNF